MRQILVGFSRSKSLYSRLIRWATDSEISHCYLIKTVTIAGLKEVAVYHADGTNVHEMDYDAFRAENIVVDEIEIEVPEDYYNAGETLLYAALGKPYSYKEILGFGWVLLNKTFNRTVSNPLSDGDKGFFCSALIARYLGYSPVEAERMSPVDIHTLCISRRAMQRFMNSSKSVWAPTTISPKSA